MINIDPDLVAHGLSTAQLVVLIIIAWRAGRFVQRFDSHAEEDERRFGAIETRLARMEKP